MTGEESSYIMEGESRARSKWVRETQNFRQLVFALIRGDRARCRLQEFCSLYRVLGIETTPHRT
jgi:hypothetical protein